MEPRHKRQRANSEGETVPAQQSLEVPVLSPDVYTDINVAMLEVEALQADNGAFLKNLVAQLATQQPSVAQILMSSYDDLVHREKTKVHSFGHHVLNVRQSINKTYPSIRGIWLYYHSAGVIDDIRASIKDIVARAGVERASFGTKSSGIHTLCEIGQVIIMSSGHKIANEVEIHFEDDTTLEAAMLDILRVMSADERERLCLQNGGRSSFLEKIVELKTLAYECVFRRLPDVIRELRGLPADEDDGDGEQEEDGEEDDDEVHEELENEDRDRLEFLDAYDSDGAPIPHKIRAYKRKYGRM